MTSIEAVSGYLPQGVPIDSLQEELGLTDGQLWRFRRFYGLAEVCRAPGMDEVDLLLAAAEKLDALRGSERRVRYVLRARTVFTSAPYPADPLAEVCRELGLGHAIRFAVTHHTCASGLLAVDLAGRLLAADGDPGALALILTGEKTFTPAVRQLTDITVMGEGAAAVLVRAGGDRDRLLGYATRTHGRFAGDVVMTQQVAKEFHKMYPDALAEVMRAAVATAGLTPADISLVLPHNVNRVSWIRVAKLLGLPIERFFLDNVPATGHCFCADPFLNHQTARELGRLRPGDRYLMVSVGLGAVFSAMVFQH